MVAYSFQARFVDAIKAGTKSHTIRRERQGRSRHVRPGEEIQHMTGPRFKAVRFGLSTCEAVCSIELTFNARQSRVKLIAPPPRYSITPSSDTKVSVGVIMQGEGPLDFFARADGFASWSEMESFWRDMHGGSKWPKAFNWSGVMICWKDFRPCS